MNRVMLTGRTDRRGREWPSVLRHGGGNPGTVESELVFAPSTGPHGHRASSPSVPTGSAPMGHGAVHVVVLVAVGMWYACGGIPGDSLHAADDSPEATVAGDAPSPAALAAYARFVRPLLARRCQACHGALAQQAGLRLDTAASLLAGGHSGPAASPGMPAESLLLARVTDADPTERMPPPGEGEPLTEEEVREIRAWIAAGCPAPADERPEADPRDHWAFRPVERPAVPGAAGSHPIDGFLAAARARAGITEVAAEAPPGVLVRRLYVDLIGLPPSPEDLAAILADRVAGNAAGGTEGWYERLVDRLLADPRHAQRWARHWMDVWRYSDWWGLGDQLRNSSPHIWHWRDWIVESLAADLPYDEMVRLMLAADELYPDDPARVRATGFLARNWFLFNRTPWLDETVEHVGKAFLGLTLNCAKCHDHKYDPLRQEDHYAFRAFFAPYHVRHDVVPGEPDTDRDAIPRVFDGEPTAPTYLLVRGDDARPAKDRPIAPAVPAVFGVPLPPIEPVSLPPRAWQPERQPWAIEAHRAVASARVAAAEAALTAAAADERPLLEARLGAERGGLAAIDARATAMQAGWNADDAASHHGQAAVTAERESAVARARVAVIEAERALAAAAGDDRTKAAEKAAQKLATARAALDEAVAALTAPGGTFTPLVGARWVPTRFRYSGQDDPPIPFPDTSTGRRRALAAWITDPRHPLTPRVAVNHLWLRHMGRPLVATMFDFGRKGAAPTHPDLLDWLAAELVAGAPDGAPWSLRHLHRLIVTSAAYRMDSSAAGLGPAAERDPDNALLWRREPVRLEAQVVRDAVLAVAGLLDVSPGGPPVPPDRQAESRRRSLYFTHSDTSRNPFLVVFDDAAVKDCYRREESVVPQQALALSHAALVHEAAATVARRLSADGAGDAAFVDRAFVAVLARPADDAERDACLGALERWRRLPDEAVGGTPPDPARGHLVWALFNHTDFVTVR